MCEKRGLELVTYNWSNHEFSKLLRLILFHIFNYLFLIIIIINNGGGELTTFDVELSHKRQS